MKRSSDWHDFNAKLDKNYPRQGKPTQLSFDCAKEKKRKRIQARAVMKEAAN